MYLAGHYRVTAGGQKDRLLRLPTHAASVAKSAAGTADRISRDPAVPRRIWDHPDLRGHQPDPAGGHGPATAEVAGRLAFPLFSGYLLGGASVVRAGLRADRGEPGGPAICPLFLVGSRRFRTA
jgi:hypothetical protein